MHNIVHNMNTIDTAGLPYNIRLANKFPYHLTCNIDIADGFVNGCTGLLRHIKYESDEFFFFNINLKI